jgi:hypothetical protein
MITKCVLRASFVLVCVCLLSVSAFPQARVKLSVPTTGQVRIEAELTAPARSWSFRNAYANALGIAERVEDFRAFGESGQDARVKKSAAGEFRSELEATKISYTLKLSEPRSEHLPFVSWLVGDRGVLMFADLLPIDIESLSCNFVLPPGWSVESPITPDASGRYHVSQPEKAVFLVGTLLRKQSNNVEGMLLETVVSGTWKFKGDDASKVAARVMRKNFELTGFRLPGKSVIMIAPLPATDPNTRWKAETRGSTIVLLVNPAFHKDMSTAQLGVIFSHEALHLWVPNSLKLEGDYDWFFEGFTMYTALRTALELKVIDFKEFLNTLGGAYKYYLDHPDKASLVEASEKRWTGGFSHVYIKGMLVAFLYDLMLRKESGGKATLADRYRSLFSSGVADGANGNEAIIKLLGVSPATSDFTKAYIENSGDLKLEQLVPVYGLEVEWKDQKSQLKVSRRLDEDQKQLLRSLGY